jgi:hypothetical protein
MADWLRADDLSRSRLETRVIVDHLARYRILYLAIGLAILGGLWLWAGGSTNDVPSLLIYLAVLLVFVLPRAWPRLERGQQIVQDTMALTLTLTIGWGALVSLVDVFDRDSDARLQPINHRLTSEILMGGWFVAISLIVAGIISLLLAVFLRPRPNRTQLSFVMILVACSTAVISGPAAATRWVHNSGEFLAVIGMSLITSVLCALGWVTGIAWLLVLARRQNLTVAVEAVSEDSPADKYVSAGSSVAVAALLIAFFGLTTCWGYAGSLDRLIGVRTALAADMVAAVIGRNAQLSQYLRTRDRPQEWYKEGTLDFGAIQKAWPKDAGALIKPAWMEQATITPVEFRTRGFLDNNPTGSGFDVNVKEVGVPGSWQASPTLNFPGDLDTGHTLGVAANCADTFDSGASFDKVYWTCEKSVLGKGVKFPFVDVEFPVQYVIGATFLALAGCLIVLSDRIEAILEMPPSSKIEPWILLDASRTGSRWLANGWVLALVAAPWLLIATAVRIESLQVRAEGSVSTVLHDAVLSGFLLVGVIMAAYLSRSLLGGLITLRRVRKYQVLRAAGSGLPAPGAEAAVVQVTPVSAVGVTVVQAGPLPRSSEES